MKPTLADELTALLGPLAEQHGLELVAVETAGGRRPQIVRIFLDREGGIDIEAIAAANAWIAEALDTLDSLQGSYTLEVSSPGIERPLRTREHFERFAGDRVAIHTAVALDGRSRFTGTLVGLDGDDIVLEIDGKEHRVPFDAIERARLKVDFGEVGEGNGRPR